MATNPRYKKAKLLRDYMIQTDTMKMFKEEETENNIFFRTLFPMSGDQKQVIMTINDSVYFGLQILLVRNVPKEKNEALLELLNICNLELPTIKYVLTTDQCVIASMFFPADEKHFNEVLIMATMMQVLKNIDEKHYGKIKELIGE